MQTPKALSEQRILARERETLAGGTWLRNRDTLEVVGRRGRDA